MAFLPVINRFIFICGKAVLMKLKLVYLKKWQKSQLTLIIRQKIIALKNEGLACREFAKKVKMSVSSFNYQQTLRNLRKL